MTCKEKEALARHKHDVHLPLDGMAQRGLVVKADKDLSYKPVMHYIAMMECDDEIKAVLGDNKYGTLGLQLEMTASLSQFAYDKQGIIQANMLLLGALLLLACLTAKDCIGHFKEFETYNTPYAVCFYALMTQGFGIVCALMHELTYQSNGVGFDVFEVFSVALDMLSECLMSLLVIMLANGWMTRYIKYDLSKGCADYGPLFFCAVFIHILLGMLSFVDSDAHQKYHGYHSWVGVCIVVLKLLLVAVFFFYYFAAKDMIKRVSLPFYNQVCTMGLVYLLSDPLAILLTFYVQEYNRFLYYRCLDQGIHMATQLYIYWQMSSRKSLMNRGINEQNALPGYK